MRRLLKPSINLKDHPKASTMMKWTWEEMMDWERTGDNCCWKREKEKEWSQNSQPTHDGKSPGPHAIQLVLCKKDGMCGYCICNDLQWGTCVHATIVEARTSEAHTHGQAANHWWCMTHHTPECWSQDILPHACMAVKKIITNYVGFCQHAICKCTHHTVSKEREVGTITL